MDKDPAFLMYAKDWLQGTSQLMPEEKGVFIDLLCHQHQDGSLPADTRRLARMAGMTEEAFLPIWETLKVKFKPTNGNRLVNQKLNQVVVNRSSRSLTNRISGEFASLIRLSTLNDKQKEKIKSQFSVSDFTNIEPSKLKERLTEWFRSCSTDL